MRRGLSLLLAGVMVMATLAGCGGKTGTEGNAAAPEGTSTPVKKEIVVAQSSDIKVLDPHDCNQVASFAAIRQIFGSLVVFDQNMKIVGDLATEWTSLSPTEWEFKLRKGVKWHDGTEFTAKDVKFSIERQQSMPKMKHLVSSITEVQIVDDYTVRLKTAAPDGTLLINLAGSATRMVPEKAVTEMGAKFAEQPVGTGPMKFVEWVQGEKLVLEKNKDYYEDTSQFVDRITFKGIPEGTSRTIALETGEVDLIVGVEATDKEKIQENTKLALYESELPRVEYVGMNTTKAPFDNTLVRQAISYAIDKDAINTVANNGRCKVANTVVGPSTLGYNGDLKLYPYSPEKAKALLAEAGFPNGFSTTIWASGDVRNRIAQIVQSNLAEIGVKVDIELLETSAYLERTGAGEHSMCVLAWEANGDGDLAMYPQFHSSKHGAAGNRSFYTNADVDKMLDEARVTVDLEKRSQLYKEAQAVVMGDAPWVPLYFPTMDIATQADLKGLEMHPTGSINSYRLHF